MYEVDTTLEWMRKANAELGQAEIDGDASNPRILEYLKATELGNQPKNLTDAVPWCSAFVSWCLPGGGTRSAWAKSYLHYGIELKIPIYGCVVVLARGLESGHVGFFVGEDFGMIQLLGGNQHNKVCVESYGKERVLSYRWPSV